MELSVMWLAQCVLDMGGYLCSAAVPNGVAQGATKRQEAAEKAKAAVSEQQMSQVRLGYIIA